MKAHLGVWGSFLHTLLHSWEHEMWLSSSLLARTFASPCLGYEPKARVATKDTTRKTNNKKWKPMSNLRLETQRRKERT
jgi:hypothetical protein